MITDPDLAAARRHWHLAEPLHAVVYFAPEIPEADAALGLRGFWMSYFAGRAAPMGPVTAPVVTATFYNFAPRLVERAIPDAWSLADPAVVLDTRLAAVERVLGRLLGDGADGPELIEAAGVARLAALACPVEGRPLAAAWAGVLDQADDLPPSVALWLALTVLREHRGDGHVAALVTEGVGGCEAHVLLAATGAVTRERQQGARAWTDDEWEAATDRLVERGWLAADRSSLSPAGIDGRARVEDTTDRLALAPWLTVGADAGARFDELLRPLCEDVVAAGEISFPNPIGLPPPAPAP